MANGAIPYSRARIRNGPIVPLKVVLAEQEVTGLPVPCRGTIHDMGRSVTHKRIICYKRLVEKKPTSQVAQETFHSADEVEYYVQTFRRVQFCKDSGMGLEEIAQATGHSQGLDREYLELIEEFKLPPLANPGSTDSEQAGRTSVPNGM